VERYEGKKRILIRKRRRRYKGDAVVNLNRRCPKTPDSHSLRQEKIPILISGSDQPSTEMKTVLIIGATRNLGEALCSAYSNMPNTIVYATARFTKPPIHKPNVHWIGDVDITSEKAGQQIALHYNNDFDIDLVIFVASSSTALFAAEKLEHPDMAHEIKMYKTTAIGPVFVVHELVKAKLLKKGCKVLFVGSEAGSIANRKPGSEGGNYGHHGSKAALNMVSRLLSLDLKPLGVAVGVVHPDDTIKPEYAAKGVIDFADGFDMEKTGTFWSAKGPEELPW
jgi:NAD(P)-dependent dehydrogenase (short-subunit alcohol dehydrogenase family)